MPEYAPLGLPGFGEQFTPLSEPELEELAGDIFTLIRRYVALKHFGKMIRQWHAEDPSASANLLPLPKRNLTLPEKYAVLGAIYNACNPGAEPIEPWPIPPDESPTDATKRVIAGVNFVSLCRQVLQRDVAGLLCGGVPARNKSVLRAILNDVEADLKTKLGNSEVNHTKKINQSTELKWRDFPNLFPLPLAIKTLANKARLLDERIAAYNIILAGKPFEAAIGAAGVQQPPLPEGAEPDEQWAHVKTVAEAPTLLVESGSEVLRCIGDYDYTATGWPNSDFILNAIGSLSNAGTEVNAIRNHYSGNWPAIQQETMNDVGFAIAIFNGRLKWFHNLTEQAKRVAEIEHYTGTRLESWQYVEWFEREWETFSKHSTAGGVTFGNYCESKHAGRVTSGGVNRALADPDDNENSIELGGKTLRSIPEFQRVEGVEQSGRAALHLVAKQLWPELPPFTECSFLQDIQPRIQGYLFLKHGLTADQVGKLTLAQIALILQRDLQANATGRTEFTLLERFPATPAGHVKFLEFVRDEVHYAAEAKRQQLERGYSNETIESMVRGIKWTEGRTRAAELSDLPAIVRANIGDILFRELTAGTIGQIDALLTPAVCGARDSLEQARRSESESKMVVVTTAGELWKVYVEGLLPCFQSASISIQPGANTPTMACTDDAAEARRIALDRAQALVTAEGGDKAAAMERLIARVQLQEGMDKASVINMSLADFVAAAMGSRAMDRQAYGEAQRMSGSPTQPVATVAESQNVKPKKSTAKGDAQVKMIPALTEHHKYENGSCLNTAPIGVNELARLAGVSQGSASRFFTDRFQGHDKYQVVCRDAGRLADSLKALNGEFAPHDLYGRRPPNEGSDEDE